MTDTAIFLRPLQASDFGAWSALWRGYLAYYETELPEEIYRSTFDRLLGADRRDFNGFLAIDDAGTPVGLAHFLFHRHCWRIEDVCYLQDLYAAPQMRGRGVGRALVEAVYAAADEAGAPAVYWLTQDFNTAARRLYDRVAVKTPFIKYQRP